MNVKIVAISLAAVLILAGASAFMIMGPEKDDDAPVCDTWYATYGEHIDLDPIHIESENFTMDDKKAPLVIENVTDGYFEGEWEGTGIQGSYCHGTLYFENETYPFDHTKRCYVEAKFIDDRILLTVSLYNEDYSEIVGAGFVQYTRKGTTPVGLVDKVDFDREFTPSSLETFTDESIGNGGTAFDIDAPELGLLEKKDMITVMSGNEGGRLILISTGFDDDGCATAFVLAERPVGSDTHQYTGIAVMGKNTLYIHCDRDIAGSVAYVVSMTYTVDYPGGTVFDAHLEDGTQKVKARVYDSDGNGTDKEFDVTVKVVSSGFRIVLESADGERITFIGTVIDRDLQGIIAGPALDGYIYGHIDGGRVHLTCVTYDSYEDDGTFLSFEIGY